MLDQAHDFFRASGALTAIEYKDVIEAQLRTYLKGGFQLLSLNDFTGQGYAPVGILDPFWNTKGSSHRKSGASSVHRLLCCSVSTNAHFTMMKYLKEKRKYTIMTYPMKNAKINWSITDSNGKPLKRRKTENNETVGKERGISTWQFQLCIEQYH